MTPSDEMSLEMILECKAITLLEQDNYYRKTIIDFNILSFSVVDILIEVKTQLISHLGHGISVRNRAATWRR